MMHQLLVFSQKHLVKYRTTQVNNGQTICFLSETFLELIALFYNVCVYKMKTRLYHTPWFSFQKYQRLTCLRLCFQKQGLTRFSLTVIDIVCHTFGLTSLKKIYDGYKFYHYHFLQPPQNISFQ